MRLKHLRSLLFVPATSLHLVGKAAQRGADAIVVDLEDAVPAERKAEARAMAATAVAQLTAQGATVLLRVNAEPALLAADLAQAPLAHLAAVMLPKVESPEQVLALETELRRLAPQREKDLTIVALVESARGVIAAGRIASATPRLCALGFGAEDYAAEMGVTPEPASMAWPAQQVATCARAFGLACWGLPGSVGEVQDTARLVALVAQARAMGFTGSVCIHPAQVSLVNAGFGPTADDLAWARRVVEADGAARETGAGTVLLDGRMIDRPVVERARRWLAAGNASQPPRREP
jgi:citrate lyase subunit beta/citryl-CoA lyase